MGGARWRSEFASQGERVWILFLHSQPLDLGQLLPVLGLCLLICKMGTIIVSTPWNYWKEDSSDIVYAQIMEHKQLLLGGGDSSEEGRSHWGKLWPGRQTWAKSPLLASSFYIYIYTTSGTLLTKERKLWEREREGENKNLKGKTIEFSLWTTLGAQERVWRMNDLHQTVVSGMK